jgi:RNA polymerase sigma-70 factor (ECF subfamily)
MAPDDCTLVHNALNGNRQAFDVLAGRYLPRIFQLVGRFFNSRQQAEDIVQDILLQAYQSLGTYGRERPFISWLMTIAVRRCCRELRLRSKRSETVLPELSGRERECIDQCCLHASSHSADPEAALIARDITARLLAALSAREQMVLTLRDVQGDRRHDGYFSAAR